MWKTFNILVITEWFKMPEMEKVNASKEKNNRDLSKVCLIRCLC